MEQTKTVHKTLPGDGGVKGLGVQGVVGWYSGDGGSIGGRVEGTWVLV